MMRNLIRRLWPGLNRHDEEHEGATAAWDVTGEFSAVDNRTRRESYDKLGLTITRAAYLVGCKECGRVSGHAKHKDAVKARRDHYFDVHAGDRVVSVG